MTHTRPNATRLTTLPTALPLERLTHLIHAAIDGKYAQATKRDVRFAVRQALQEFNQISTERSLFKGAVPSRTLETDVANQVRCLLAIEHFWRFAKPSNTFIFRVHAACYGYDSAKNHLRTKHVVQDYSGPNLAPVAEINNGLTAIHKLLTNLESFRDQTRTEQASYLSSLQSTIIRIHPFKDGNGRLSRMMIQYCLRFWGYDYITLPKVRNSQQWKLAMEAGVGGDYAPMTKFLAKRLKRRTGKTPTPQERPDRHRPSRTEG